MSIWGRDWVQDEMQPANTKIEVCWWETNAFSFSLHAEGGTRSLTAHSARPDL